MTRKYFFIFCYYGFQDKQQQIQSLEGEQASLKRELSVRNDKVDSLQVAAASSLCDHLPTGMHRSVSAIG